MCNSSRVLVPGRRAACSEMRGQGLCLPCRSRPREVSSKLLPPMLFWVQQHPVSTSAGGALGRCLQCYCIISGFVCTSCLFCNLSLAPGSSPSSLLRFCRAQSTPGLDVGSVSRLVQLTIGRARLIPGTERHSVYGRLCGHCLQIIVSSLQSGLVLAFYPSCTDASSK